MNKSILQSVGILTLAAALTGCSSTGGAGHSPRGDVGSQTHTRASTQRVNVYGNMTPELMTLNERPIDVHRNMAYTHNHNGRMFWSDLGRVFMTDHPSRLTNTPVISMTGNAR